MNQYFHYYTCSTVTNTKSRIESSIRLKKKESFVASSEALCDYDTGHCTLSVMDAVWGVCWGCILGCMYFSAGWMVHSLLNIKQTANLPWSSVECEVSASRRAFETLAHSVSHGVVMVGSPFKLHSTCINLPWFYSLHYSLSLVIKGPLSYDKMSWMKST